MKNKIVASNKFRLGKQDFKYFIGYKDNKKIKPLCVFFPEMSISKSDFDKTKCMYFMIKDEKMFHKYMKIWEKVSNIIKSRSNREVIYNKKYLKFEKKIKTKKNFQCFYTLVLLIDSVYRKDQSHYPKLFFEKFIHNFIKFIHNFF